MRDDKTLTIAASNEAVIVHPDRLQVTVAGAPSLNVPVLRGRAQGVADCWCRRGDLNFDGSGDGWCRQVPICKRHTALTWHMPGMSTFRCAAGAGECRRVREKSG